MAAVDNFLDVVGRLKSTSVLSVSMAMKLFLSPGPRRILIPGCSTYRIFLVYKTWLYANPAILYFLCGYFWEPAKSIRTNIDAQNWVSTLTKYPLAWNSGRFTNSKYILINKDDPAKHTDLIIIYPYAWIRCVSPIYNKCFRRCHMNQQSSSPTWL